MKNHQKFIANSGFIIREIAGELLLVPIGSKTQEFNGLVHINGISKDILDLLQKPRNTKELIKELKKTYDVIDENVQEDIEDFLKTACLNNIISVVNEEDL